MFVYAENLCVIGVMIGYPTQWANTPNCLYFCRAMTVIVLLNSIILKLFAITLLIPSSTKQMQVNQLKRFFIHLIQVVHHFNVYSRCWYIGKLIFLLRNNVSSILNLSMIIYASLFIGKTIDWLISYISFEIRRSLVNLSSLRKYILFMWWYTFSIQW